MIPLVCDECYNENINSIFVLSIEVVSVAQ